MKTREITLSASLMALYVAIIIIGSTTPFRFTGLMYSALFGIFWNYFSLKQNLTFQAVRLTYNLSLSIYALPRIMALMKTESIAGLTFLEWFNSTKYPINSAGIELLTITGKARITPNLFILIAIVSLCHCLIMPYVFYKYFKKTGIFRRLPSF